MLKLLRRYLKPYFKYVLMVMLFQIAQVMCTLYLPNMTAHIIDNGVTKGDINYIWNEGGLMILISLVQIFLSITATYFGAKAAFSMSKDIRSDIYHKIQNFSVREMGNFGAPTLITRATNDINQVQQVSMFLMTLIVSSPIMFIGGIVMSLEQDIPLSGVIAVTLPVIVIVAAVFVAKMVPYFRRFQKKVDRINEVMREQISGVSVVRAFTREKTERKRFSRANRDIFELNIATGRLMTLMFPVFMFIINVSILAIMWFGGIRVDSGEMEIGAITAFITYMMYIMMSVLMSSMIFVMWPRAEVSSKRIREVFKMKNSVVETKNPVQLENPRGEIEFKNAKFRYAGAQESVVRELNFKAMPGKTTAIIGSTGSGKTTIVNLIPRLYDVTDGEILFDGVNVKNLKLGELDAKIGLIPQKSFLFSGTVAENMRFAKQDATDDEIWEALEIASAASFVKDKAATEDGAKENALNLRVSQGGANFSGGQRQRLAIARAIVRRPLVYLFDDSFSALDYATDAALRKSLSSITQKSTVIIVAQRVSTVRHADNIIVLDAGKIVDQGTHEELMERCETYREIVDSQLSPQEALK